MGLNEHLSALVDELSAPLPGVTKKRMFGCDAFFASGNIYSLIWKTGRIGLKLLDDADFETLRAMPGAETWTPGAKMVMSRWLLVPESFHDDPETLGGWVRKAHAQALLAPKKASKTKGRSGNSRPPSSASKKAAATNSPMRAVKETVRRSGRAQTAKRASSKATKRATSRGSRSRPAR
ncbi:MAG: TfoX/Sxy family protein [Myxococcaceae bacterium]|nr:TfoX/Sxy family protein [Myxococcaceae bacterium]